MKASYSAIFLSSILWRSPTSASYLRLGHLNEDVAPCTDIPGTNCSLYDSNFPVWCSLGAIFDPSVSTDCCACGGGNITITQPDDATDPSVASNFTIELLPSDGRVQKYDHLFEKARQFWMSVIVGDLPDYTTTMAPGLDLFDELLSEPVNRDVDDILVAFHIGEIDGVGGTLGFAGPVITRIDNEIPTQPISAIMVFDEEDFALRSDADLELIILHELGHALGFGSYWSYKCGVDCETLGDHDYTCPNAVAEYAKLSLGDKLLITNDGGEGSICSHWEDDSFRNTGGWSELMTPFFDADKEQLVTTVTVGAFADLGYEVNYAVADDIPYTTSSSSESLAEVSTKINILPEHRMKPSASFSLEGIIASPKDIPESIRSHLSISR